MFNWRDFCGFLICMTVLVFSICLIATGLYMMCEAGNAWGYALIVGGIVLGGSISAGFGL